MRGQSRREWLWSTLAAGAVAGVGQVRGEGRSELPAADGGDGAVEGLRWAPEPASLELGRLFRRLTLEMSLKPFRDVSTEAAIRAVCEAAIGSWVPLARHGERLAVMLWTADGSEILDYAGKLDEPIEWGRYIGIGTPPDPVPTGVAAASLHSVPWLYTEHPARITYGTLRTIVGCLRETGQALTGLPVEIGATFDPGPEFARSSFKYERHPEIAQGATMGRNRWVNCAAVLEADERAYAGFPEGIPAGTSLGTFLGRQSRHFLTDLGFDYLWLSNGFGFGLNSWSVKGLLFDGERFDAERAGPTREAILGFWRDFRRESPELPLETRGSNLTVGADLASGASPLGDIYRGGFGMTAPPNSPWAALDGDFGLELVGYLSRTAELPPGDVFPFRYYIHDPWWLNSPWLDRYGREPHDIYLPLALARLDGEGAVTRPSYVELLTIDDSYGRMPEVVPREVVPHLLTALADASDEPGLLTWVYPFDEYHESTFGLEPRLAEPFFGDWFMRGAVNAGLPLNTVISTGHFLKVANRAGSRLDRTTLVMPVPDGGTALERAVLDRVANGQDVLFYGPTERAGAATLELLNLATAPPIDGELELEHRLRPDALRQGGFATRLRHPGILSAGGVDTVSREEGARGCETVATVARDGQRRVYGVFCDRGRGRVAWVRGSFCNTIGDGHLPVPDDPLKYFRAEVLMRWILERFGLTLRFELAGAATRAPVVLGAVRDNGLFFSGYSPSSNTRVELRLPGGVPLLVGAEMWTDGGLPAGATGQFTPPRAWHRECRVRVEQAEAGELSCVERHSELVGISRRLHVRGLKEATVRFWTERPGQQRVRFAANDLRPYSETSLPYCEEDGGRVLTVEGVSGELLISW